MHDNYQLVGTVQDMIDDIKNKTNFTTQEAKDSIQELIDFELIIIKNEKVYIKVKGF